MASIPRSEYLGFTVNETSRVYLLRVTDADGNERDYSLSISNRAFLEQRVRYQDAPAICFLKLERELLASGDSPPAANLRVTNAELTEFAEAHTKPTSFLRPHQEVKP